MPSARQLAKALSLGMGLVGASKGSTREGLWDLDLSGNLNYNLCVVRLSVWPNSAGCQVDR